jgi:hypothetical protein
LRMLSVSLAEDNEIQSFVADFGPS